MLVDERQIAEIIGYVCIYKLTLLLSPH